MSDARLLDEGKAAAYMADPKAQRGGVNPEFVMELRECRAEWRRRRNANSDEK